MQTFLPGHGRNPEAVFLTSCDMLDRQRLGAQRKEAMQLLNAMDNPSYGWHNHPACQMWIGYRDALKLYYNRTLEAWALRGYRNEKLQPFNDIDVSSVEFPPWLMNSPLRSTHRLALYIKAPKHALYKQALTDDEWQQYRQLFEQYGWELHYPEIVKRVCKDLYYWPTRQ